MTMNNNSRSSAISNAALQSYAFKEVVLLAIITIKG